MASNDLLAFDLSAFPRKPSYKAQWSPVYWEPIMGSGERITVLIGAVGADGEVGAIRAIRQDTLPHMYGGQAKKVSGIINVALESLKAHLEAHKSLSGWRPPIGGVYAGPSFEAQSVNLKGVFRQAIQLSASLSSLDEFADEQDLSDENEHAAAKHWSLQIKEAVAVHRPDVAAYFNSAVRFYGGSLENRIGFLGLGLAAHFSLIRPSGVRRAVQVARAKLWELAQAKQTRLDVQDAGLLLYALPFEDPLYSSTQEKAARAAINSLQQEAGKNLWVETAPNTQAAAEILISRLAASA